MISIRDRAAIIGIGQTAFIDFSVRGQYYKDEPRNDWKANLQQQVVKIRAGAPENLIMTKELEAELEAPDSAVRVSCAFMPSMTRTRPALMAQLLSRKKPSRNPCFARGTS